MAIARRECVNIDVFIGVNQGCVRSYGRACEIERNGVRCFWRNYGVVGLLDKSICGIGETRLLLYRKNDS